LRWKAQEVRGVDDLLQMVISVAKESPWILTTVFLSSSLPFSNVFQDSVGVGGGGWLMMGCGCGCRRSHVYRKS